MFMSYPPPLKRSFALNTPLGEMTPNHYGRLQRRMPGIPAGDSSVSYDCTGPRSSNNLRFQSPPQIACYSLSTASCINNRLSTHGNMYPNLRAVTHSSPPTFFSLNTAPLRQPIFTLTRPASAFAQPGPSLHHKKPRCTHWLCSSLQLPTLRLPLRPLPPPHLIQRRNIAVTSLTPGAAMFSQPAPEPGADFNVVMIGAGVSRRSGRVRC